MRITDHGEVETLLAGFSQLADLGYDAKRGIIGPPVMSDSCFVRPWLGAGRTDDD